MQEINKLFRKYTHGYTRVIDIHGLKLVVDVHRVIVHVDVHENRESQERLNDMCMDKHSRRRRGG